MWFTMLFSIFIIPREICNTNVQYAIWTLFIYVLFFKFLINHPISLNKKLSSIHIRILILQNFSLFSICEVLNIIDHTRISNFIIVICIKPHIHSYQFSNIYFLQCIYLNCHKLYCTWKIQRRLYFKYLFICQ